MMTLFGPSKALSKRLASLESHLKTENPILLEVVPTYFRLDKLLYRLGLLDREESLASRISWWPLISILGTFSSGKSTFINHYVGEKLQSTGNQAVDDKFTVVCYGSEGTRVLPGTALDADPRFPFYRMSDEIDKVAAGEGRRIDTYLQLKTTAKPTVRGKIIIDSPGFDADDQRRSILRLTNHIVDLSDLVLVFFDARHPEPGAMQDTLRHLVASTIRRPDASKFLYILNQIDTTAREDNPEDVVGAWQRALAQAGLISGRFYCIYNPAAAVQIADPALRKRFETKRDIDLGEIHARMSEVEVQRSYRIISVLEMVANEIEQEMIPTLIGHLTRWRRLTLVWDSVAGTLFTALVGTVAVMTGIDTPAAISAWFMSSEMEATLTAALIGAVIVSGHLSIRDAVATRVAQKIPERAGQFDLALRQAFRKNTRVFHSIFNSEPTGWGRGTKRRLQALRSAAASHIQRLNDIYTDPSGRRCGLESVKLTPNHEEPSNETVSGENIASR